MTDPWADRAYLRGSQYTTDANLAARQSIYAYQQPRVDLAARVLDLAAPAPGDTVVDAGCGNGMYLAELARRGARCRVLGADLSVGMVTAARDRLAAAAGPGARAGAGLADGTMALAGADATALPLRDGTADVALAAHMLYHVPEPADALRELRRVTRPGGRVVIVLNGDSHLNQLRTAVAAARGADPATMGERVRLDDGESLARPLFAQVTRYDFVAELRVPAAEPVVRYFRSWIGTSPRRRRRGRGRAGRDPQEPRGPLPHHQPRGLPHRRGRLAG